MGTDIAITEKSIVLFDGVCNLCNSSVNFIIDRDKAGKFLFASLQSQEAAQLSRQFDFPLRTLSSIILIENGGVHTRSSAALRIARRLDGLWPLLSVFMVVPRFLRDGVYEWIAKNRYRWFGRSNSCRMPEPALKQRFLQQIGHTV